MRLPALSLAVTTNSTSPASVKRVSHSNKPRESLLPLHTVPKSLISVLLS
jgi:hypothetical protein